ncbi:MAG: hypothetical protein J2P43_02285 [Candidatus Dormibacteraeota bacterium]|nr:hypothetical protein [Candidatus Dormibacteraeota bacterium]
MAKSKSSQPAQRRAGQHSGKSAGGRARGRGRGGSRREFPTLAAAAAAAVLVAALVIGGIYFKMNYKPPPPTYSAIDGVSCDKTNPTAVKIHANLQIFYQETPVAVPANVGVKSNCSYWLHTSDDSGVIAVTLPESQKHHTYTLATFFAIWGQPINKHQVTTLKTSDSVQMKVWVDGSPYHGNPADIPLTSHRSIVIQFGPPFLDPPPSYTWDTKTYPH